MHLVKIFSSWYVLGAIDFSMKTLNDGQLVAPMWIIHSLIIGTLIQKETLLMKERMIEVVQNLISLLCPVGGLSYSKLVTE